jgi:hypothetical protein
LSRVRRVVRLATGHAHPFAGDQADGLDGAERLAESPGLGDDGVAVNQDAQPPALAFCEACGGPDPALAGPVGLGVALIAVAAAAGALGAAVSALALALATDGARALLTPRTR